MTPHQRELLIMLAEEAGELVQACTKALRHGLDNHHPDFPNRTNTDNIRNELADLLAVYNLLSDEVVGIEPHGEDVLQAIKQKMRWMRTKPGQDQHPDDDATGMGGIGKGSI